MDAAPADPEQANLTPGVPVWLLRGATGGARAPCGCPRAQISDRRGDCPQGWIQPLAQTTGWIQPCPGLPARSPRQAPAPPLDAPGAVGAPRFAHIGSNFRRLESVSGRKLDPMWCLDRKLDPTSAGFSRSRVASWIQCGAWTASWIQLPPTSVGLASQVGSNVVPGPQVGSNFRRLQSVSRRKLDPMWCLDRKLDPTCTGIGRVLVASWIQHGVRTASWIQLPPASVGLGSTVGPKRVPD